MFLTGNKETKNKPNKYNICLNYVGIKNGDKYICTTLYKKPNLVPI